ncbi:MAG TPA: protein kinase [Humisphaera sp.]|jgi:serine/threonine-protein kinase|nr:protein kinase [Humisphaera sp.]
MSSDPRIDQLLEHLFETKSTPEEVCKEYPELLPEVRHRWREINAVESHIDQLFPPSAQLPPHSSADPDPAKLPEIPGYRVESILGRGGVGVVYKAYHLKLNRTVAMKMLLSGAYASSAELARFTREARAIASIDCPQIVQVHDIGEFDGRAFFTMEFVPGGSLAQKLAGIPQPPAQAAALVATVADAIGRAHKLGILHRDLKPANILLTSEGQPKICDFGLASSSSADMALTLSGVRLGTPSYMAPEQAHGKLREMGPAVDVYSLGAILYEMLTGRPPFRGESAAETERQLLTQEPVAPSRLCPKVPRDLETICLKCLHKDPKRRYDTGLTLSEDLVRFQHGEPIVARPIGAVERSIKFLRRHPTLSVAVASALLLLAVLLSGAIWMMLQRKDVSNAVDTDLKDVAALQQRARWTDARTALDRASAHLGNGGPFELQRRITRAAADLDLVMAVDQVRLSRVTSGQQVIDNRKASAKYAQLFRDARLGSMPDSPADVAHRIRQSAIRSALIAACDDWAACADNSERHWVFDLARRVDPDPQGWRDRVFDEAAWANPDALAKLSDSLPPDLQSLSLLLTFGDQLRIAGRDAAPFLRRVQQQHPDDFWANLVLGNVLLYRLPSQALGYYRAALSSRPGAAVGYCVVGDALRLLDSNDEAIRYYEKAIAIAPRFARGYTSLGLSLEAESKPDAAANYYQRALQVDPDYSWTYYNMGDALLDKGQLDAALEQFHRADALDPGNPLVFNHIRTIQIRQGRVLQVWQEWRQIIKTDPPSHDAWWGYAELSLFLGKEDEYKLARTQLLRRFGDNRDPLVTEKVAKACLLLPGTDDEMRAAAVLADRAVVSIGSVDDHLYPYFMFAKALSEYRLGKFQQAVEILHGPASKVLAASPKLLEAMAQQKLDHAETARELLDAAIRSSRWDLAEADSRDTWMMHILRHEAEAMIRN